MDAAELNIAKRAAGALRWALRRVRYEPPTHGCVPIEMDAFGETKDDAFIVLADLEAAIGPRKDPSPPHPKPMKRHRRRHAR